jgi:hypothetical protein
MKRLAAILRMNRSAAILLTLTGLAVTACSPSASHRAGGNLKGCCLPTPVAVISKSCNKLFGRTKPAHALPPLPPGQYAYIANEYQHRSADGDAYEDGAIAVYPVGQTTVVRTIHSGPVRAIAFDAGHIYAVQIADCNAKGLGALLVYDKKTGILLRAVTQGIASPRDILLDHHGNIYVDNIAGKIAVYNAGATRLVRTISEGVNLPGAFAIDSRQNLYVANQSIRDPQRISVYRYGSVHVSRTIYPAGAPLDLAIDHSDNLYVASTTANNVTEYAAGTNRVRRVLRTGMDDPNTLGITRNLLYVGNAGYSTSVYDLASGRFVRKIPYEAYAFAFDRTGRVYLSTWHSVMLYSPGGVKALQNFDTTGAVVAVDPR